MKRTMLTAMAALMAFPCLALTSARAQSVLTYHNAANRSGLYTVPGLTFAAAAKMHLDTGFSAIVSGNVYAQPLYWEPAGSGTKLLIVATESNTVYGLNANTGAQVWKTQLLPSAPVSELGCGNINPEGITGTPVIDQATGTLYFDALVSAAGGVAKQKIYALSVTTGKVLAHWPIDVENQVKARRQGFDSTIQGERSAVQFVGGKLYVNYAGRDGDCGPYHGIVVEFAPSTRAATGVWETRATGGGIWGQGGVASDGKSLYATTGNTTGASKWSDGEAVIRLKSGVKRSENAKDFFTPSIWHTLDNEDLDLGGSGAVQFQVPKSRGGSVGRILALGKNGYAYLLDSADLGGAGGALASLQVSNSVIITEPAVYQTSTYAIAAFTNFNGSRSSCSGNNLSALKIVAAAKGELSLAWCSGFAGGGAPIVTTTDGSANPIDWVVGAEGDNQLHAFQALTGEALFSGGGVTMNGLHRFSTLIAANHHLYVTGDGAVYAFTF
jgi:outer membrane protein assembly factor BamB